MDKKDAASPQPRWRATRKPLTWIPECWRNSRSRRSDASRATGQCAPWALPRRRLKSPCTNSQSSRPLCTGCRSTRSGRARPACRQTRCPYEHQISKSAGLPKRSTSEAWDSSESSKDVYVEDASAVSTYRRGVGDCRCVAPTCSKRSALPATPGDATPEERQRELGRE